MRNARIHLISLGVLVALVLTVNSSPVDGASPLNAIGLTQQGAIASSVSDETRSLLAAGWAVQVAAGDNHTCALTTRGGVMCWGENDMGQMGDGSTTDQDAPVDVPGLDSGVIAIAAGGSHGCALTGGGGVQCWGNNADGQLGNGGIGDRFTPRPVTGLDAGVHAIATAFSHTCAVMDTGAVKCWGNNEYGQLGDGTTVNRLTPVDVLGLRGQAEAVAPGLLHTCALLTDGGVQCWGYNGNGQLGDGTVTTRLSPVDVLEMSHGARMINAGSLYSCAVTATGGARCWGDNYYGTLGDGTKKTSRWSPVDVTGLQTGVLALTGGVHHTCAVLMDGSARCWGDNGNGELGDNTMTQRLVPVSVTGLATGASSISSGITHTCAVTGDAGIQCWGFNSSGQLGDGTHFTRYKPVDVLHVDCAAVSEIPQTECEALLALSHATGAMGWENRSGWLRNTAPCSWQGVTCSDGHVSEIVLHDNSLSGTLPAQLVQLTALEALDLSLNNLSGRLPAELCDMPELTTLDLHSNKLEGTLPLDAGCLPTVRTFNLSSNQFGGTLTADIGSRAGLESLDVSSNDISGPLPVEMRELQHLTYLNLSNNDFSGAIPPELSHMAALTEVHLDTNGFEGAIPPELGELQALRVLSAHSNRLSGSIPPEIGSLATLEWLNLSRNQLSGPLPVELEQLTQLTSLYLNDNQLTGMIPPELGQLATLQTLDLGNHRIIGWSPPEWGNNQLSGAIPPELGQLSALENLDLRNNQLSGSIPAELGQLAALQTLQLEGNQLGESIPPELGDLASLRNLYLSNNHLSGNIPPELGGLAGFGGQAAASTGVGITTLTESTGPGTSSRWMEYAPMPGTDGNAAAPEETVALPPSGYIDLSCNQLSGTIPAEIAQLADINGIDLSGNQLSGPVPAQLGGNSFGAIDYNMLDVTAPMPDLRIDAGWEQTQTAPPTGLSAASTGTSVTLTWSPIEYTANGGYYEIEYGLAASGSYTVAGHTADKSVGSYTVTGLARDGEYAFRVRTYTPAHQFYFGLGAFEHLYNQQSDLWSAYTKPVRATIALRQWFARIER